MAIDEQYVTQGDQPCQSTIVPIHYCAYHGAVARRPHAVQPWRPSLHSNRSPRLVDTHTVMIGDEDAIPGGVLLPYGNLADIEPGMNYSL